MKKRQLSIFTLLVVLFSMLFSGLGLSATLRVWAAEVTPESYSDGFNSSSFINWVADGADNRLLATTGVKIGSSGYAAKLSCSTERGMYLPINATGYENITISLWYKSNYKTDGSYETGGTGDSSVQISYDNGASYTDILPLPYTSIPNDNVWKEFKQLLTVEVNNNSGVRLRLISNNTNQNNYYAIDDLEIKATPITVKSSDADLSSLEVAGGTLDKSFDKVVTEYTLNVAEDVTGVNITAVASSPVAQIKVGDTPMTSGQPLRLDILGTTTSAAITVTAEDGTTKTYTLTVNKMQNSSIEPIKFVVSEDTYVDGSNFDTTNTQNVNYNDKSDLNIKGTYQSTSGPKYNRIGYLKYAINVNVGKVIKNAKLNFYVTGIEKDTAKLRVVGLTNNDWNEDTITWKTAPDYVWNEAQQTSKALDENSPYGPYGTFIKDLQGTDIVAGWNSVDVSEFVKAQVAQGINTISFKVYDPGFAIKDTVANSYIKIQARSGDAADDDKLSYIEIEEGNAPKGTNADLAELSIISGINNTALVLEPAFDRGIIEYTSNVTEDVTSINVAAKAADSKYQSITINGARVEAETPQTIALSSGVNDIEIIVTAEDEVTTKAYKVTVNKSNEFYKNALRSAIEAAQQKYDNAVVGTKAGTYTQESKEALKIAISEANAVVENKAATKAEIDAALAELNTDVEAFESSLIKERDCDINGNGIVDSGDLAYIAFRCGKDTENTSADEWNTIQVADINKDGQINEADMEALVRRKGGV